MMSPGEKIYILRICCNELTFDVCINIIDLFWGTPGLADDSQGIIWLQGELIFRRICSGPEEN